MQPVAMLHPPVPVEENTLRSDRMLDAQTPIGELLHFSDETLPIWTPFRARVLNYIFRTALGLLGDQLESATVSVSSVPDEEDTYALNLTLAVTGDWPIIRCARDELLTKVSEWSMEWSRQQQEDYGRRIYFGLIPTVL